MCVFVFVFVCVCYDITYTIKIMLPYMKHTSEVFISKFGQVYAGNILLGKNQAYKLLPFFFFYKEECLAASYLMHLLCIVNTTFIDRQFKEFIS